ncbi:MULTISPECIES: DNA polymerase III subunit epsilon [Rhodanobacter]|uniref:DNA polymerase III subunit epsilon n=1 Tax=Rhodanobacter denitrificans TaxID=666685 RepID=I4WR67_9GAMM|nr:MULTISPECIES: DNA polymerase III subunit epsilon [Rhodanobacter]AGG89361.1 DNA polymerase III, epsilon subunit [Rhodanobacter denitrificans]EIM01959.1 DNA polymerase III subunit epsilon [Rhodanobacter denitrificans]KZC20046.1 DNA polymerase III subunit epsilon [Rhodanobacter denitrificans]UJJ49565.1 DNA polymerase III subunit epsilon [Rhodanobacter denitrificans]UJJ58235.1 DNA polymerase III subunit epsilon [Rhodanobacter denitrificans]
MRQIVLDTETTGLEVRQGHRLVEIACVELVERRLTGRHYQTYLNPDRAIDEGARLVTGIEDEFLLDKPRFAEVAEEFLAFIDGAELIIHNASFDIGFLDAELARLGNAAGRIGDRCSVLDTLAMARERYPGQRNSLDALCKRLGVDNSRRDLHGGLIDAQLLADVYLAMTSGQVAFDLGFEGAAEQRDVMVMVPAVLHARPRVLRASAEEISAHEQRLAALDKSSADGQSVWRRL